MMSNHINIKFLKILLWNSNGLKQNEPELLDLLIHKKIDIALIMETHHIAKTKNFFPGYSVYRTDQPDGTAYALSLLFPQKLNTIVFQTYNSLLFKQQIYQLHFITYPLQYLQSIALLDQRSLTAKLSYFYNHSVTRSLPEGTSMQNIPTGVADVKTLAAVCSSM